MDRSVFQPNPTTNNDDNYVGDPALANMIGRDLIYMKEAMVKVQKYVDRINVQINQASQKFEQLKTRGGEELSELKVEVKKLKSQIPSKLIMKTHYDDDSKPRRNPWFDGSINRSSNNYQVDVNNAGHLHSLYKEPNFRQIKVSFDALSVKQKICLACFSLFPEMVTIKKRLMIYWWIGEGLVSPTFSTSTDKEIALVKTAEEFGNEFLDDFTTKSFIEPIYKNRGLAVDSYRMHPFVHSFFRLFCCKRVCTLDTFNHSLMFFFYTCFLNVGEAIIDDRFEGFFKFIYFTTVYLGRWQDSVTHHIEVTDTKILNALKNMKKLRFLSLRGISLITELPQYISQMTNLKILDLKACHNLEVVPDWIGLLKNLTHLDISECYFLDHMPKGLGSLSELQVLKGFIIGDSKDKNSCTIDDLAKLSKLRKLSLHTNMKEFPSSEQLHHLQTLKTLQKLKISWTGCILQGETDDTPKQAQPQPQPHANLTRALTGSFTKQYNLELPIQMELPSSLQKLELECFPKMVTPSWLSSGNLKNLKKLHIRGGLLCHLDQIATTTIEMLQLKYLSDFQMHWMDLRRLFPNLIYLEKIECPGLISFPCDEHGVWMNRANTQNQEIAS
ncbi:disease resistance RPP13-like protein 4 [Camellia sinensis]|uniref:disease resistance RPP13-like protein 4 n=1 Tax=Camellia sinensis TaxID=4442 RepID=UPI00103596C2|nr:disease resistance RPP13-like protein 4 [Camellia sinensis]XP_028116176.1 disease resistance RPP13-like protein 4 [Camellia sinensis]